MRTEHLERLKTTDIKIDDVYYLHYKHYHKDLFSAFNEYATGKLLDIGCGNKPYQDKLKDLIQEYIGIDIVQSSENMVDFLATANNIPLESDQFETVISTQTIEHVEDHQGLVNEAYRLLKSNGIFIISGPMYWPLHEEPHDFFRFTRYGFKYILEKAGFKIIQINSNGGKWSVAGQAFLHALYPQIYSIKGLKGKLLRFGLNLVGGIKSLNRFFIYMDNQGITDYSNTMNYVIVAKKIEQE